jgi:maleylacetoacetate isomerase
MDKTVTLFDYWRSSACYRVRIALGMKRISYRSIKVEMLQGAHRSHENLTRNPQGFVPTLEINGVVLTQSLAILLYLEGIVNTPALLPSDPIARCKALARALVVVADIHPLDNLQVLKRLRSQFDANQAATDQWYAHWIGQGFAALEATAGDGPFLGGNAPDISDVCLVPQMYNARRFSVPLHEYPKLVRADAAATRIPAFLEAHPDRFRSS